MIKSDPLWSVPVRLDEIPETGRRLELRAEDAVRAAVAGAAGVVEIARLEAAFDLSRLGRERLRVVGTVSALVNQNCVVTLEPVETEVEEAIDLVFAPASETASGAEPGEEAVALDGAADPPEPLVDGVADLGAVAVEFLILGIDPYPRKAGVAFEPQPGDDPGPKPFAALAGLRTPRAKR